MLKDIWNKLTGRRRQVLFLGDSHVKYFERAVHLHILSPGRRYRPCIVGGATAVGLRNPNSATDALNYFRKFLRKHPAKAIAVFHMGEVDCGFVIWHRAQRLGESIDTQVEESLAAYMDFVDEVIGTHGHEAIMTAATVPTIPDGHIWGDVATKRKEVTASLAERTALTRRYNEELAQRCKARGIPFLDITAEVIDPHTGVVSTALMNSDPKDHHLEYEPMARLWAAKLNPILDRLD